MKFRFLENFSVDFEEGRFLFDTYYDFYDYSNALLRALRFYAWYYDKHPKIQTVSLVDTSEIRKEIDETLNCMKNEDDFDCTIEYFEDYLKEVNNWAKSIEIDCKDQTLKRILVQLSIEIDFLFDYLYFKAL